MIPIENVMYCVSNVTYPQTKVTTPVINLAPFNVLDLDIFYKIELHFCSFYP